MSAVVNRARQRYWERFGPSRLPPGEDLAALRRGAGRDPGSVPAMWPFYTVPDSGGANPSRALVAEHHALVLFGFHQQSKRRLMHQPDERIGVALRSLRATRRYRERPSSLDARVAAAATAASVGEVAWHLRGLVALLAGSDDGIPLDYSGLFLDLKAWHSSDGAARVRRRWGSDYFQWGADVRETTEIEDAPAAEGDPS